MTTSHIRNALAFVRRRMQEREDDLLAMYTFGATLSGEMAIDALEFHIQGREEDLIELRRITAFWEKTFSDELAKRLKE